MKKVIKRTVCAVGIVAALAAIFAVGRLTGGRTGEKDSENKGVLRSRRVAETPARVCEPVRRKVSPVDVQAPVAAQNKDWMQLHAMLDIDGEDKELTDLERKVMKDLLAAVDGHDQKATLALVNKLLDEVRRSGNGSTDCLARPLRRRIVQALGWFGGAGAAELATFLADSDPEIRELANDQFNMSMMDFTLSDRERAEIIVAVSQVLNDASTLDSLYMQFLDMRHSVAIDAMVQVAQTGTDTAAQMIPKSMKFYTGQDNIDTVEAAQQWVKENPDGEDDDKTFGGRKKTHLTDWNDPVE